MFLKHFKKRIFIAIKQCFTLAVSDIKSDTKTHPHKYTPLSRIRWRAPNPLEKGAPAHCYCVPITFMSSLLEWLIEMIETIGISSPFGFLLESG